MPAKACPSGIRNCLPVSPYPASPLGLALMAAIDLSVFFEALWLGVGWNYAHAAGFAFSMVLGMGLWALGGRKQPEVTVRVPFEATAFVFPLCVLFLRGGLLATLVITLHVPPEAAIIFAVALSSMLLYSGDLILGSGSKEVAQAADHRGSHHGLIWSIIVYTILLRLFYSGPLELLHEEGYYWLYAQFLDIGYLDHPPMVAWLIWALTTILGQSEFAIRFGAFVCWLITATYMYRLTDRIAGQVAALRALLLVALLPAFFAVGMIMLPDAPLVACWAGALYYLYRALIDERPGAWLGVGIFMGLGLLSKYTMVLLGGAAVLFIVATPASRRWFKRPEPYLAAGLAFLIFSPVIVWNAQNEWVSFYFQGIGRHKGAFNFGVQDLVASALVLLTPIGLLGAVCLWVYRKRVQSQITAPKGRQAFRLFACLTIVPLSVFFAFSLFHMSKLNWTAPIWLGLLPYLALFAHPIGADASGTRTGLSFFPRLQTWTTAVVLVLYGAVLHYMAIGLPGIPYPSNQLDMGKRSIAHQIAAVRQAYADNHGDPLLIVCWQDERLAGWLSYYLSAEDKFRGAGHFRKIVENTTGAQFFGENSKMFRFWHPDTIIQARDFLLVSPEQEPLQYSWVLSKATPTGDIQEVPARINGRPGGHYFYRYFHAGSEGLAESSPSIPPDRMAEDANRLGPARRPHG